jgi:acyl dehydratase
MGRYFDEFQVGKRWETLGRTIGEADIHAFAALTGDWNPVHVDETVAAPLHGGRIAHGTLMPGLAWGMLRQHDLIEGTVVALKSLDWEFVAPVRIGDTLRVTAEVVTSSPHPKEPRGRVTFALAFLNQRGETVNRGRCTLVMQRKTEER